MFEGCPNHRMVSVHSTAFGGIKGTSIRSGITWTSPKKFLESVSLRCNEEVTQQSTLPNTGL